MKRVIAFVLVTLLVSAMLATPAAAFGGVGVIDEFNRLDGDQQYLTRDYRENYYLDIEEIGILDADLSILNSVANALFSIVSFLGYCIVAFFYFCFTFDINELFGEQINAMQTVLKSSIFDSFFILAFAFAAWELAKKLFRRNLNGMMIDGAKIVLIVLLSSFVVRYSGTTLTAATNMTKDLGVAALSGLNEGGSTNTTSYAVTVSANLWKSLVHDPWVTLEFGRKGADDSLIREILSETPGSESRQAIIQEQAISNPALQKTVGGNRIGYIIVYLIPFLVKSAVFVLMAVIQIAFQVMALFFVLLAPVILLMSLVPALGGIDLITLWLKKVFETQLMILIITFLIGVIVKVDALLYSKTPQLGWMIVILMETLIAVIVFFNYKSILSGLGKINSAIRNPRMLQNQFRRSGDAIQATHKGIAAVEGAAGNTISGVKTVGKGSLNVAKRIQQIGAASYNALADYYNSGDDTAPDPAPTARRRIKTPTAAQPSPAGRRPVTVDFKNPGTAPTGRRRSKVPYLDVAFVDVTDDKVAAPRPSIPRAGADPKSDAYPPAQGEERAGRPSAAAAQRNSAAVAGAAYNAPAAGQKRPSASVESFRRPAASADAAPDETAVNRPSTPAARQDTASVSPGEQSGSRPNAAAPAAAPLGTAKAIHAAAKPQLDKAPVSTSNARKASLENKRQLRRPRAAARHNSASAGASEASPTGNQTYSAAMATFRRPTAATDITGNQSVSRPNTTASGNSAAPVSKGPEEANRPTAAAVFGTSDAPAQEQPAGRPRTKNVPIQAAAGPASAGSKAAVKVKPGGRAAPPPAAPTAPQESRHVPHARVNMVQPPENMKKIERPTLQAASSKKTPTPAKASRAADKPPRRSPSRSPAGAKTMPADDAATTPRPATPSKQK